MIIKGKSLSVASIMLFLSSITTFAEEMPCPTDACTSCGYSAANVSDTPSYAVGVPPIANYVATSQSNACRGYWSGLYLGAAYGLGVIDYNLEVGGVTPGTLNSNTRSYLTTILDAGFNIVVDYFFLGAEVGYNYRSRTNQISYLPLQDTLSTFTEDGIPFVVAYPCEVRFDINSQHAGTADLLPGLAFSRFVVYLRLGFEQTKYNIDGSFCFPSVLIDDVTEENLVSVDGVDFAQSFNKTANGYRLGIGFGYAFSVHLSLHLNYVHTFENKISVAFDTTDVAANVPVIIVGEDTASFVSLPQIGATHVFEPQRNEVNLGVKFRF